MRLGTVITYYLVNIYFFKVSDRNTRKKCEICSKVKALNK